MFSTSPQSNNGTPGDADDLLFLTFLCRRLWLLRWGKKLVLVLQPSICSGNRMDMAKSSSKHLSLTYNPWAI
jgi:hypothetical protein